MDVNAKENAPRFSQPADTKPPPLENYSIFSARAIVPAMNVTENEKRDSSSQHAKVVDGVAPVC